MKKLSVLLCLILTLSISAFAASPKIVDDADLLTASQEATLETRAEALASEYGIDVVIVTVDSLGYKTATEFADDYFDNNGYGVGPRYSGVLFLLSMEDRDWAISTHGNAISALTDYGLDQLFGSISGELEENNYYTALSDYLTELDVYFEAYANGTPIDREASLADVLPFLLGGLVLGLIAAAATIYVMKRGMNTARAQNSAQSYVTPGTFEMGVQRDIFLYSHTSRVRRSESDSGGSSTHRSSSGRSHGGRSGKF